MKYFLSPFYLPKRLGAKFYLEHKYTKHIILIPQSIFNLYIDPKIQLLGLTMDQFTQLNQDNICNTLLVNSCIINGETSFSEISDFFVLPKDTFFGIPYGKIMELEDSLVLLGIPYKHGNPVDSNLDLAIQCARNYCTQYSLTSDAFYFSEKIMNENWNISWDDIFDLGDLFFPLGVAPEALQSRIENIAYNIMQQKSQFIAIGGDHSISYPLFKGVQKYESQEIVFLHIDAHNDLYAPLECHFPDIAIGHGMFIGKLLLEGIQVITIGLRDFVNKDSLDFSDLPNYLCYFSNSDAHFMETVQRITKSLKGKKVYLTFDMDVIDPLQFKSVTNPMPNGISFHTATKALDYFFEHIDIVAMDIVEADLHIDYEIDIQQFLHFLAKTTMLYNKKISYGRQQAVSTNTRH